jgi:hypothetical protein
MTLRQYKKMFKLDTDEKFKAHCKKYRMRIVFCSICDEIQSDPNFICCWDKARD